MTGDAGKITVERQHVFVGEGDHLIARTLLVIEAEGAPDLFPDLKRTADCSPDVRNWAR
jgi:hypothetical protein